MKNGLFPATVPGLKVSNLEQTTQCKYALMPKPEDCAFRT